MQKKRYGEKRKGGYVDMGKQVSLMARSVNLPLTHTMAGFAPRTCSQNHQGSWRHEQPQVQE
jgi:hypothetical protein